MAGDSYRIEDQQATYFLTLTIVHWTALFIRREYKDAIVESLNYCIEKKGLVLNGWVIMTNHIHLIGRVESTIGMSGFLRDFKKYTSKKLIGLIEEVPESRREWLLDKFSFEARRIGRAKNYKVWKDDNHAVDLTNNNIDILSKLDYLHMNPVNDGWVRNPEEYIYSSAIDYSTGIGIVKVEVI